MSGSSQRQDIISTGADYDAVVVGASLAGCATAIMLARAGARVALVEQRPDEAAYKKICSHYIQSSAVATLERLELLEPMLQAGAVRSRVRIHSPWGWIEPPVKSSVPSGVNLRREVLDPLIRRTAAETPGVELIMGHTVHELLRDGEAVCGRWRAIAAAMSCGCRRAARRRRRARLARGQARRRAREHEPSTHGRIAYGGYFEGPPPSGAPDASFWLLDPDMAAAFPTDSGLTFYAAMPTKEREERVPRGPGQGAGRVPRQRPRRPADPRLAHDRPGAGQARLTNVAHTPTAPGLALVGDAALAIDPLWGVGCGWALQSAEWLADSVSPALVGRSSRLKGAGTGLEALPPPPRPRAARSRDDDLRLRRRAQVQPRRAAAVLGGRLRSGRGTDHGGVRHPQHRTGADASHGRSARAGGARAPLAVASRAASALGRSQSPAGAHGDVSRGGR